jgi:GNAT superfamily N-acetyltransferase
MSVLRLVSPTHPAAAPLLAGLRYEYHRDYGPTVAGELHRLSPIEFLPPSGAFLILEQDGMTVAGGALRRLGGGVGEIKRMWTAPAHRGRGYDRRVLAALEAAAARRGYHTLQIETDPRGDSFEKRLDGAYDLATDELDRREILVREMLKHHPLDAGLRQAA